MRIKALLKGAATYVPGLYRFAPKRTSGTISARYCYSVWLKHLVIAYKNGLSSVPNTVAELGPGYSLGIGLAALISGAEKYYALDVVEYSDMKRNLEVFDELAGLFHAKESIPDESEYPRAKPFLDSYEFPSHILCDKLLDKALRQDKLDSIRKAVLNLESRSHDKIEISYFVPWHDSRIIKKESVDMVFSQAVLEHIDDLPNTYRALYRWLKPRGFMSHQVDFGCHETAGFWNGHWAYTDFLWKLIRGSRPYFLNREPHSAHVRLLRNSGFDIVLDVKGTNTSGIQREQLAPRFRNMSDDDLTTSDALLQAKKG